MTIQIFAIVCGHICFGFNNYHEIVHLFSKYNIMLALIHWLSIVKNFMEKKMIPYGDYYGDYYRNYYEEEMIPYKMSGEKKVLRRHGISVNERYQRLSIGDLVVYKDYKGRIFKIFVKIVYGYL
eukprot:UN23284